MPFMKIRRDMPFPTEPRQETDAEHTYTLGIVAITVAVRLNLKLDTGLIAKYVLVHDLVEAYTGDVSVRTGGQSYHDKEAAEREAISKIKDKYKESAPWIAELIEKYDAKADDESKLIYAVDKFMGALVRMADKGETWADYYPEPDGSGIRRTVGILREKAKTYLPVLDLFETFYGEADKLWPEYMKQAEQKKAKK